MATPVIMPRQGQSVESCIITKWNKKVGDKIAVGDSLFTYETDKSTFDEEAKVDGELLDIFFNEGDDVACLLNVCVIGQKGESTAEFAPKGSAEKAAEPEKKTEEAPVEAVTPSIEPEHTDGKIKISPRAKELAARTGADIRRAVPSGPNGRIIERDIRAIEAGIQTEAPAAEAKPATEPVQTVKPAAAAGDYLECEEVKLPNIRKVIAKSMHSSVSSMAQLTLNSSFDATAILEYRAMLKANKDKLGLSNITLNDIVLYAVAKTLPAHKDLNAHFYDDKMVYFRHVNLGVAVDTPRGLMVPTLFGAEKLSLNDLSAKTKTLIDDAQKGTINPDLLKNGTFTVTNLGSLGVESFTPIINPPQTAILGVNNTEMKVKEVNGEIKYYKAMSLSLTFDHRAVDGAPAAKFLQELCGSLENFTLLLSK